jgi:hypothetical protein
MRTFIVKYWNKASTFLSHEMTGKSKNEIYQFLYDNGFQPLSVKVK